MKFLINSSTDPFYNMAFDEAVLERGPEELVFYLWRNSPAVIIGRNQNPYAEVNLPYLEAGGISLVRRITGGGAVYHDLGNLNYSFAGPLKSFPGDRPTLIVDALRAMGIPAELGGRNDIFVDGRKCSGYAKRLSGTRMMIHGTLMFDVDLDRLVQALSVPGSKVSAGGIASVRSRVANLSGYFPGSMESFTARLQSILGESGGEWMGNEALSIDDSRFRSWEWNFGLSPAADFRKSSRFPCGTVEASFSLFRGRIRGLRFGGDFLGELDSSALEAALEGCPFRLPDLLPCLALTPRVFDSISPSTLASFLLS